MSVNIKYKNNIIAELTETAIKTLKTSGKYCEADIIAENTKDGGSNELFHAEITPATSGEVLTLEVGEIGERIAAMIVSIKLDEYVEQNKNYGILNIAAINKNPVIQRPSLVNVIAYRDYNSIMQTDKASYQEQSNNPSGIDAYTSYYIVNSTGNKPLVKLYVTNGAESKYGLLVGKTYDIWVIKD